MSGIITDITNRVGKIILQPKLFWEEQKTEKTGVGSLFFWYVFPLILITSALVFVGEFFSSSHFYAEFALLKATSELVLLILVFFVAVYFTAELMKNYGGEKNVSVAAKLVSYSFTPILLVFMLTGLIKYLYFFDLLGLYSFYLFWTGGKTLLEIPDVKRDKYLVMTLFVNFFVFVLFSVILSRILTALN